MAYQSTPVMQSTPGTFYDPRYASAISKPTDPGYGTPAQYPTIPAPVGTAQPSAPGPAGDSERTRLEKIGANRNPKEEEQYRALLSSEVPAGPSEADINAVYEPTMNYLNQAETAVRGDFPNVLSAAQTAYETAIQELTAGKEKASGVIKEAGMQAGAVKESALASARRLYDELRRGYQQRFGGSTSAGQAAFELAGVEQQRQMGGYEREYGTTTRQLEQKKVDLENEFNLGSAKILQSKNEALAQANRDFQNKLLEIAQTRATTESQKAAAKLDALNTLQQQAFAIQQQSLTYQQNLDMFYKQQQADLDNYAAKLSMTGSNAQQVAANYNPGTATSGLVAGGGTTSAGTGMVGQTTGQKYVWDAATGSYKLV